MIYCILQGVTSPKWSCVLLKQSSATPIHKCKIAKLYKRDFTNRAYDSRSIHWTQGLDNWLKPDHFALLVMIILQGLKMLFWPKQCPLFALLTQQSLQVVGDCTLNPAGCMFQPGMKVKALPQHRMRPSVCVGASKQRRFSGLKGALSCQQAPALRQDLVVWSHSFMLVLAVDMALSSIMP